MTILITVALAEALLQSTTPSEDGLTAPNGKRYEDGWKKQENKQEERIREQSKENVKQTHLKCMKRSNIPKGKKHSTKANFQETLV